jgi:hypothetical protein
MLFVYSERETPENGFKKEKKIKKDILKLSACEGTYIESTKILFLNKYTTGCASWKR